MEFCLRYRRVKVTPSRVFSNARFRSKADPLQGASIVVPFVIHDGGDDCTEAVGYPVVQLDVSTRGEGLPIFIKCSEK